MRQLRTLGIILGVVVTITLTLLLIRQFQAGEINWYYVVMGCGMLLLLFYTIWKPRRRPPKNPG